MDSRDPDNGRHRKDFGTFRRDAYIALLRADMSEAVLYGSLKVLSELLEKHYGRKAVLLIDEYDVPLAKALDQGYYDRVNSQFVSAGAKDE